MKKIKIAHVGDLHLGYRQYGLIERKQDFNKAAEYVVDDCIKNNVNIVIFPGDIFDTSRPHPDDILFFKYLVSKLKDNNIGVVTIDGNHDMSNHAWSKLCGIECLYSPYNNWVEYNYCDLKIVGFHYTRGNNIISNIEQYFLFNDRADIVVIHQTLNEVSMFNETGDISLDDIDKILYPRGVKYVAMGHIHLYKDFTTSNGIRVIYPGSIESCGIDEIQDKYYVLIDYDDNINITLMPIPNRQFVKISIDKFEDLNNLEKFNDYDNKFLYIEYNTELNNIVTTIEKILTNKVLYKVFPKDSKLNNVYWDRGNQTINLYEIVSSFYDKNTDEYKLICQLLLSDENAVVDIINNYLKENNLTITVV